MNTKIEFNPTHYKMGHGKLPRGRACWAFQVARIPGMACWGGLYAEDGPTHFSPPMTLTEAKAWMRPIALNAAGHRRDLTVTVNILP
jgi:hypothetical protein